MYASIRRYKSYAAFEVLEQVKKGFVPLIAQTPGFVEYHLIRTDGTFISLSIFQTQEAAKASNKIAQEWVRQNIPSLLDGELEYTSGELVITQGKVS